MKLFKTVRGRAFFAAVTATLGLALTTFFVVILAGGPLAVALHNSYVVVGMCSLAIFLVGVLAPAIIKVINWVLDE